MKNWFEIDKAGLAKILARKGKEFILFELIQNAWDEKGVTEVKVRIVESEIKGYAVITVEDNAPEGFSTLAHAYTLFAESAKKNNPEQRGRFNFGEKLVLAIAVQAKIETTKGTIFFSRDGRTQSKTRTETGSLIELRVKMTHAEITHCCLEAQRLIPPPHIETQINGKRIATPDAFRNFDATLTTEISDFEGRLTRSARRTVVRVYEAAPGSSGAIYEMGIPVCEIEGRFIFDVCQKIPLTIDREEVLPSFRKQLAVAALNSLHADMTPADANSGWATEASASPDAAPEAVNQYLTQRFGEKRVAYDPSDVEANKRAVAEGYTVVSGGMLSGGTWKNAKASGAILPAGQVTPSPKPYSETGKPLTLVKELTPGMAAVETYAKKFALEVLGANIGVIIASEITWPYAATYGPGSLTFNAGRLGKAWFDLTRNREAIDALLIHEFGHHYSMDHLSAEYYDALCNIGAGYARALREGRMK